MAAAGGTGPATSHIIPSGPTLSVTVATHVTTGTPSPVGSKASKFEEVSASISPGDHTGISKGEGPHRANFPRIVANFVVGMASS